MKQGHQGGDIHSLSILVDNSNAYRHWSLRQCSSAQKLRRRSHLYPRRLAEITESSVTDIAHGNRHHGRGLRSDHRGRGDRGDRHHDVHGDHRGDHDLLG